jgi:hypothetical protein
MPSAIPRMRFAETALGRSGSTFEKSTKQGFLARISHRLEDGDFQVGWGLTSRPTAVTERFGRKSVLVRVVDA